MNREQFIFTIKLIAVFVLIHSFLQLYSMFIPKFIHWVLGNLIRLWGV